jgi:hypothetical protein
MKFHGFCLFVLLSTSPAVQAQATLAKESDENLDKQVKALEKKIQVLEDQLDLLRKQHALVLAEQGARAAKQWEIENKKNFAKVEVRGTLTVSPRFTTVGAKTVRWDNSQAVVGGRSWEVLFPEKDKELLAAAEMLIGKEVIITGTARCSPKWEPPVQGYNPYGHPYALNYTNRTSYLFIVAADSLTAGNADDKKMLKKMEAVRDRIDVLSAKSDDVLTKREYDELLGLRETLKKLSKQWQAQPRKSDKLTDYAKVQFRGTLVKAGADAWEVTLAFPNWRLNFGDKNELKELAKEQEGKRVDITGTVTADPWAPPTVNVEALKRAEE